MSCFFFMDTETFILEPNKWSNYSFLKIWRHLAQLSSSMSWQKFWHRCKSLKKRLLLLTRSASNKYLKRLTDGQKTYKHCPNNTHTNTNTHTHICTRTHTHTHKYALEHSQTHTFFHISDKIFSFAHNPKHSLHFLLHRKIIFTNIPKHTHTLTQVQVLYIFLILIPFNTLYCSHALNA